MQTTPLTPEKIVFNCNVLIVRTMQRNDLKTSQKADIWRQLINIKRQFQNQF